MSRYIDADELEKRTVLVEGDDFDGEYVIPYASFESMPTADVVPVIHAHWESLQDRWPYLKVHECSKCGFDFNTTERMSQSCVNSQLNFCPHCGARMDEEAEEKK